MTILEMLHDDVCKIEAGCDDVVLVYGNAFRFSIDDIFSINFHNKTEITRPIQEATEADIKKLCFFWDEQDYATASFGILAGVDYDSIECRYFSTTKGYYKHARRLTKQEIEELC